MVRGFGFSGLASRAWSADDVGIEGVKSGTIWCSIRIAAFVVANQLACAVAVFELSFSWGICCLV